jgi:hypothetical protein
MTVAPGAAVVTRCSRGVESATLGWANSVIGRPPAIVEVRECRPEPTKGRKKQVARGWREGCKPRATLLQEAAAAVRPGDGSPEMVARPSNEQKLNKETISVQVR